MELDELKSLINERMERVHTKSPADFTVLLGRKTQSVVGKIKRSLVIELIASLVFTLGCAGIAVFGAYTSVRIYFGIFAVICALFLPLLYVLLGKTKKLSQAPLPVKHNLQTLANLIREYIKRYFQLTMALIPISIIIAFFLGYSDENLNNPGLQPLFPTFSGFKIGTVILYIVVFSVGMYYFTKWYLKKLYGNYIEQLDALLNELEENR